MVRALSTTHKNIFAVFSLSFLFLGYDIDELDHKAELHLCGNSVKTLFECYPDEQVEPAQCCDNCQYNSSDQDDYCPEASVRFQRVSALAHACSPYCAWLVPTHLAHVQARVNLASSSSFISYDFFPLMFRRLGWFYRLFISPTWRTFFSPCTTNACSSALSPISCCPPLFLCFHT
jgi:hypothetical protein